MDPRPELDVTRGKRCPECGSPMHAQEERPGPAGTTVTYVCRSGGCASVQRGFPAKAKTVEQRDHRPSPDHT